MVPVAGMGPILATTGRAPAGDDEKRPSQGPKGAISAVVVDAGTELALAHRAPPRPVLLYIVWFGRPRGQDTGETAPGVPWSTWPLVDSCKPDFETGLSVLPHNRKRRSKQAFLNVPRTSVLVRRAEDPCSHVPTGLGGSAFLCSRGFPGSLGVCPGFCASSARVFLRRSAVARIPARP